jgi:SAM-dependent methyltransferase
VRQGRGVVRSAKRALGMLSYLKTDDRQVLEQVILPYFAQSPECSKILFVGTAWYTEGYNALFRGKDYWTIELDPSQAKYGSRHHIIDSIENVNQHFQPNQFDLIICNGVFGWGLNDQPNVEVAFTHCFNLLHEGGILVLGWNDVPAHCPFPLGSCEALKLWQPFVFSPLATAQYRTTAKNRHTFNFYIK